MKKFILISIFCSLLFSAQGLPMPPSIPMLQTKTAKVKKQHKTTLPKSCQILPPMIFRYGDGVEKLVNRCKSDLHKPSKKLAEKKLENIIKRKVKVTEVQNIDGIARLYVIKTKKQGKFYCNDLFDICFKNRVK